MDILNNHGSFAHCRGDTFHALSPDVANRENSGKARFKRIRGPVQRPAVLNLRTGLNEAICVERETTSKPFRVGIGAGHHEYMLDVAGFVRSSFGVVQPNPLKVSVAFKRFDCEEESINPLLLSAAFAALLAALPRFPFRDIILASLGGDQE